MTKLLLIRHGQTAYNQEKRYSGSQDISLNQEGMKQMRKLRQRLCQLPYTIDKVFSSNLQRAIQSAQIIFPDIQPEQLPALREMHFGVFEGLLYEEVQRAYAELHKAWLKDPLTVTIPQSEPLCDFSKRVLDSVSAVLHTYKNKTIAIVCHGGPIRILLCAIAGQPLQNIWKIRLDNSALTVIHYDNGSPPVIVMNNDVSHLSVE